MTAGNEDGFIMIILDTNLLYEISGLEPIRGNLSALLASNANEGLGVTSVSVAEVISKLRHHLPKLRRGLAQLMSRQVQHVIIGYLPVSTDELRAITDTQDEARSNVVLSAVHHRKLEQEASFLRFMLVAVLTGTFHLLIQHRSKAGTIETPKLMQYSVSVLDANRDCFLACLTKALEAGYEANHPNSSAKAAFNKLYASAVFVWCANWHSMNAGQTIATFQSARIHVKKAIGNALHKDSLAQTIIHADNPFSILAKKRHRASFQVALEKLGKDLAAYMPATPEMLKYMMTRFEKVLFHGGMMEKNDILDMLIIIGLRVPGSKLLTRDRNLRAFLNRHHPPSNALLKCLSNS